MASVFPSRSLGAIEGGGAFLGGLCLDGHGGRDMQSQLDWPDVLFRGVRRRRSKTDMMVSAECEERLQHTSNVINRPAHALNPCCHHVGITN